MATAKTDQAGGRRAVVDAHDAVLLYAFEAGPYLIKPNRHELESLVGRLLANIEALATQARELQRQGGACGTGTVQRLGTERFEVWKK